MPITVERLEYLRGGDLRVVPQSGAALVVWETYPYSAVGQAVMARRVFPDGSVSDALTLEATWEADPGLVEPYFDVLPVSDTRALVSLSSSPVGDDPRPRFGVFSVTLPPLGAEAQGATSEVSLPETLMPTIGYGAVSQTRFVRVADDQITLGYLQSLGVSSGSGGGGGGAGGGPSGGETFGALALFELDAAGRSRSALPDCGTDYTCCAAHACLETREDLPVAVGVVGGYAHGAGVTWVLDELRPSALVVASGAVTADITLPILSVPMTADAAGLFVLEPSARTGEQLPTDPVEGPARFAQYDVNGQRTAYDLPTIRDTPRPAWVARPGKSALLITPGADAAAPELVVYSVDPVTGATSEAARIARRSSLSVGAIQGVAVAGTLYVAWLESTDVEAVIRAAVVPEP